MKGLFFPQKLDHLTDILIKDRIIPAELFISEVRLTKL